MNVDISLIGYTSAALAFAVLSLLLLTVWRAKVRGTLLTIASIIAIGWAASLALASLEPIVSGSRIFLTEIVFDTAWLFCLSSMMAGSVAAQSNWMVRRGGVALGLGLLAAWLLLAFTNLKFSFPNALGQLWVMGSIATSLYALVGIEQLYRNARPRQQNELKFFCLGLAGIFAYDLFLYTNFVVDAEISSAFWGARGFVVAMCVPLLVISVKRVTSWSRGIFASRQIVFYTTTLVAAGVYLALIGLAGYFIQSLGRKWGDALQLVFFSAAILAFFAFILSEKVRARIRVWLTKHFFERKYDYREEWLRLISTLTSSHDSMPLRKRAVKALAQIIDSPSGSLWLVDEESQVYVSVSSWNTKPVEEQLPGDSPVIAFLETKSWVIDVVELTGNLQKYDPLSSNDLSQSLTAAGFLIPLIHDDELLGFTVLAPTNIPTRLNFEDHDLLKTAGQQIASYLAQELAMEQLAASRQFEAFNRFTAFVMHDLKNAIAQQALVVENAKRHKRNPEFIDDAMDTIKGSVLRMRKVLAHLAQGGVDQSTERVDLTKLLLQVHSQCSDRKPLPEAHIPESAIVVLANRERLAQVFSHAIRNAQDATDEEGIVQLQVVSKERQGIVRITDNGTGMDAEFIRDDLFRPFFSTKGAEGMGIGAYQIRETVRAFGGDVVVASELGVGTTVTVSLPLSDEGSS